MKYLYPIAILMLGLSVPASAQTEPDQGYINGLENSLGQIADFFAQKKESLYENYNDAIRWAGLLDSDIRMTMEVNVEGHDMGDGVEYLYPGSDKKKPGSGSLFWSYTGDQTGTLHAEFDWQNMAEKMHLTSTKTFTQFGILNSELANKNIGGEDFYMFIDADGYWYVPFDKYGTKYMRVDPFAAMQNNVKMLKVGIDKAIDAKGNDMLDKLGFLMALNIGYSKYKDAITAFIPQEVVNEYLSQLSQEEIEGGFVPKFDSTKNVTEGLLKKLKPTVEKYAKLQIDKTIGFPAFIHFAFIMSPTLGRSMGLKEDPITSEGQLLFTRMTVTSGKDKGYLIIFDRYGRLVHLKDTDGNTADYWYDKDVTVNIPPAVSIDMGNFIPTIQPGISDK